MKITPRTVQLFNGVPSGACQPDQLAVDTTNGNLYDCVAGAWHLVTGGGGGTPGGSNTQVQFNDGGVFGGDTNLTWDKSLLNFSVTGIILAYAPASANKGAAISTAAETDTNGSGGPLPTLEAIYATAGNVGTGTVDIAGVAVDSNYNTGGGAVGRNEGVFIADQHGIGTNNYALRIANQGTGAADYAIKVDGGQNNLGPNTTRMGGVQAALASKSVNYTTTGNDFAINVSATATITLDSSAARAEQIYRIKNVGSGITVTISPSSGTIDGASSAVITSQYASVDIQFDGTNWWIF